MALTAAEQAELDSLKKDLAASEQSKGSITPQEIEELNALRREMGYKAPTVDSKGVVSDVIDYAGRALDYPGGFIRVGIGAASDALGDGPGITQDDLARAAVGQAPRMAELLDRSSPKDSAMARGYRVPMTQKTTVSGNDVLGFAGDVATDPIGQLGRALKMMGRAGDLKTPLAVSEKALNPAGLLTEALGKKSYKSGLKRIDREAAKFGKEPVSDLLMENRIAGSAQGISNKMDDLSQRLLAERDKILSDATRAGGISSMDDAMKPAEGFVARIRSSKDPNLQPIADAMESDIAKYKALDPKKSEPVLSTLPRGIEMGGGHTPVYFEPSPSTVSGSPTKTMNTGFEAIELPSTTNAPMIGSSSPPKWARGADVPDMPIPRGPIAILTETDPTRGPLGIMLDNSGVNPKMSSGYKSTVGSKLPESSFSNWGVVSEANKGTKAMAGGLKSETEAAVGRALGPKAQADLAKKNDALGRLITTQEKQALEAAKEANKNYFTSVDGMIVGAHNPEMLAAKKVADALKATAIRTYGGRAMMDFGKSGWADPIVRRALLDRGVEESQPSPWGP